MLPLIRALSVVVHLLFCSPTPYLSRFSLISLSNSRSPICDTSANRNLFLLLYRSHTNAPTLLFSRSPKIFTPSSHARPLFLSKFPYFVFRHPLSRFFSLPGTLSLFQVTFPVRSFFPSPSLISLVRLLSLSSSLSNSLCSFSSTISFSLFKVLSLPLPWSTQFFLYPSPAIYFSSLAILLSIPSSSHSLSSAPSQNLSLLLPLISHIQSVSSFLFSISLCVALASVISCSPSFPISRIISSFQSSSFSLLFSLPPTLPMHLSPSLIPSPLSFFSSPNLSLDLHHYSSSSLVFFLSFFSSFNLSSFSL